MIRGSRWHWPTIVGRLRSDAPLLVLMGLVVALTTLLTATVAPLSERAADRAVASAVRDAGLGGAVVATLPRDVYGFTTIRDPRAAEELRRTAGDAQSALPTRLAAMLRPGVTTVSTSSLHLLDGGPGRYLHLTYADAPSGSPAVTYLAGGPPEPGAEANGGTVEIEPGAPPWPVEVAVSQPVAQALGIGPGDQLPAENDNHQPVTVKISGVYTASDPQEAAWQLSPELLNPARGVSQGVEQTTGDALVSPESLPDLQLAVPSGQLVTHITFLTRPSVTRWRDTDALRQEVAHLQVSADGKAAAFTWNSALGGVLTDVRTQVAAAQGQAQVILVGLSVAALLVLALAARLLVIRRQGPIVVARERGASLPGIAGELLLEALLVAATGTAVGLVAAWLLVGGVGWAWSVPVIVVAVVAAPLYGAVVAARSTSVRRVPANRSARRALDRARRTRRLAVEIAVLAAAALSFLALRQRGIVDESGWGGLTSASAATLLAATGTAIVVRLLTPALRLCLRAARRSVHSVGLLVTARLSRTATQVLPVLAVSVAVAQLTFGIALAATEHHGQQAGALLAVGGDARLSATPDADVDAAARRAAAAPGVRAAVAGRVADVTLVSDRTATSVRLVVLDAAAYQQLLASSPLPDAPQLARLRDDGADGATPALLVGGPAALRDGPVLRWQDTSVALDVVGIAPHVEASVEPVVVVDAGALARAGAAAPPDTIWAVGPGAADALREIGGDPGAVATYDDELDARRDAPLASALVRLAVASSVPLVLFAVLGMLLGAAAEAPARSQSLGRLRSLGLADRDLRRVLSGELLTTACVAAFAGLGLGILCVFATFGSLSLERITGQTLTPDVVVPWWVLLSAGAVVVSTLAVALSEWRHLRRQVLAQLLRS